MNTIAIIGAGPAGLQTALRMKEEGFDATVFEEHEIIGEPTHCSGLISKKGVVELGLNLSDSLLNEITGAKLFSPSGHMLHIKRKETVAYVVDRKKFDQVLLRRARLLGIHVATDTKLIDVRKNTLFVQSQGRGELRKAEFVVGADGVNSTIRHLLGIEVGKENFIHTIQATCHGEFDDKNVHVYLGDFAKGFFAWVVPISKEKAKIGLGSTLGEDVSENLKKFIAEKFPGTKVLKYDSALIPYGAPLVGITKDNLAIVGDAAFHTKATTGGGVIFGMKAANILAETIVDNLKGKATMKDYEKRLEPLNNELKMHWKIRRYANSLSNQEIDDLFVKLKHKGIEEFLEKEGNMDEPSKFVGKLMSNPKFFTMLGTAMKFMRS
ncbi:MAG: NAD(P)/FAD-dependent oxidoreductase [archaeon]|jgi:geranylgeranyl reductase family protein